MTCGRPARESGAGTTLMAGVALAALLLLAGIVLFVQGSVAASRAATAADLSALAAADAARGLRDGSPCMVAATVASHHGSRLTGCSLEGPSGHIVRVQTELDVSPVLPPATGQARAGPPPSDPDRKED
ncbi:Rv3654c family TadE-like protein [Arthrobacter sp.]|uniref:Rv3654c family TadE-like protein n=1 Tax=Arthrobacter sp. TaxID=1667 RepID=UPI002810EB4C|nr:Rv3654c family TadE-like protein [Arthrobacter sp.]